MEPDNKKNASTETDNAPASILDNESYIKLKDPESEGFGNKSKDIDTIDEDMIKTSGCWYTIGVRKNSYRLGTNWGTH